MCPSFLWAKRMYIRCVFIFYICYAIMQWRKISDTIFSKYWRQLHIFLKCNINRHPKMQKYKKVAKYVHSGQKMGRNVINSIAKSKNKRTILKFVRSFFRILAHCNIFAIYLSTSFYEYISKFHLRMLWKVKLLHIICNYTTISFSNSVLVQIRNPTWTLVV